MTRAITILFLAFSMGCASTINEDCQNYISTGADLAIIITDLTAQDAERAELVERYAELAKDARGLGCAMADRNG